jgi:hypothetical protein
LHRGGHIGERLLLAFVVGVVPESVVFGLASGHASFEEVDHGFLLTSQIQVVKFTFGVADIRWRVGADRGVVEELEPVP